jgi:hypothetical protein
MHTDTLTEVLWHIDPMGTCCNQCDDMADEYASQARDIAERLARGEAPRAAVVAVFDEWFWEDCLSGGRSETLDQIVAAIESRR